MEVLLTSVGRNHYDAFLLSLLATRTLDSDPLPVPSKPSGLHPIFHGDELVVAIHPKAISISVEYIHAHVASSAATTGMYVAAYGTYRAQLRLTLPPLGSERRRLHLHRAETQFGPMTLVQSAFNPTGNYLSWLVHRKQWQAYSLP